MNRKENEQFVRNFFEKDRLNNLKMIAKYVDDATEYLFDTITDKKLIEKINDMALTCFNALGCRHLSRVDMIVAGDGTPYVLEINTLPGFTSHSLLPMAARKAGIETPELCKQIINAAMNDGRSEG